MTASASRRSRTEQVQQMVTDQPDGTMELRDALHAFRVRAEQDPFTSPIKLMALEVQKRLDDGRLDDDGLEGLVRQLTATATRSRALRLRRYLGEIDASGNRAIIDRLIRHLAEDEQGGRAPFLLFKERVERAYYGFVITAHPTFSLAADLQRDLLELAEDEDAGAAAARLEATPHRPDVPLTLDYEHGRAGEAIANLLEAIAEAYRIVLDVAAELYPDEWRRLTPKIVTLATWVGYDTDGRSDISWSTTFGKRLRMKETQLERYRTRVRSLVSRADADAPLVSTLELIEARLSLALKIVGEEAAVLDIPAGSRPIGEDELARLSREMIASGQARLVQSAQIGDLVDRAIDLANDPLVARELLVLRAEIANHGMAAARSHLRINGLQLHNAIRKQIGMDHAPDDPSFRLSYLHAIGDLLERVQPVQINFGSVHQERATARRVFMTMAQMLKFIDANEPIRFLIAECETGFTLLVALYYARLFNVADRVDISPLFETRAALERGVQIIDEALSVPAFKAYVRARGRLCIQAGFSDAGRYLGQLAAAVAIERVRLGLADLLHRHGLDVELVFFDTHGESIGRGGHPVSFSDRFRYLDTPESHRRFEQQGIRLCEESSFQGGDGYQFFMSRSSAMAVLTRALEHFLVEPEEAEDPFYTETSYIGEFFATVEQFNARVIADPCYAALLTTFGSNLLFPSGSRSLRRQFDAAGGKQTIDHPSQIRAIPHNSILQQFGILANTIGGLGQAIGKDPERFLGLYRGSARFRRLMMMVEHAFMFTDLEVVRAYVDLFDPSTWLAAARDAREDGQREACLMTAAIIDRLDLSDRLTRLLRVFERDHLDLAWALKAHRRVTRSVGDQPIAVDPETRDNMHLLHAVRLALIERTMRRSMQVPDFSDRHATTRQNLVTAIVQLDIEPALVLLNEIFPLVETGGVRGDYGEVSSYGEDGAQSYAQEHAGIFRPLARDYDLVRRISTALVHHLGALG